MPSACDKPDDIPEIVEETARFSGTINGQKWNADSLMATCSADYKSMYIWISDQQRQLGMRFELDSTNPLQTYQLKSFGGNAAMLAEPYAGNVFYSDHNLAEAGGTVTLIKLDTNAKKLSGHLSLTLYTRNRLKKMVMQIDTIEDIPLKISASAYNDSYIKCNIRGVDTVEWRTANLDAYISCYSPSDGSIRLRTEINSPIRPQQFIFNIPLTTTGTFPIYAQALPGPGCNTGILVSYDLHMANLYQSVSGSFTIIALDTAATKMSAKFYLTVKEPGTQEVISFTDGELVLKNWRKKIY